MTSILSRLFRASDVSKPRPSCATYAAGELIGGRFLVEDVLSGGMGVVYVVREKSTGDRFALKTLREDRSLDLEKGQYERVALKEEFLHWINIPPHPNVVRAFFVVEVDGRLFLALEYIPRVPRHPNTLQGALGSELVATRLADWAIQFCEGMEHANKNGILCHRDVKPANILLTPGGVVKITDFGLALGTEKGLHLSGWLPKEAQAITGGDGAPRLSVLSVHGHTICGTPGYMAPEVYRGEKADVRADIYAFGIVLYQMAKGTPGLPYDVAFNSDIHAYLKKVYSFQMAHRFPRLPHRYWPIIERCLNPDPSQRYSDFSALQHQVKELSGRSFIARSKQSTEAPQDSDVLVNKAASLDSLGKTEEAQKLLDHVIQIDPGNWRAHNNLGLIFKRKDQLEKAIACFQMAFELSKEATPCHGLAVTFWLKGDVDHALEWFDRGLKLAPDRVEFIADRGAMLSQHGRVEDADRAYVHAMNLAPRDPRIIIGRAQHYARTHRWNDAISLLDENAGALTTNLKFVSMAAQLRSEWQKSEGRGKITPGTEQEAPRVGSSKPYTEQEYREWRKLMGIDDAPEATVIAYRDPTFQGLLGQLVDDIKMCKVVLGLPNGPDLVREVCKLTDEQLRVVCAIAFMAYAPELVKETKSGIPMSERYQGILGARELDPLVLWECIRQILHSYEEQQQNRVRFIAIPEQLARDLKAKNLLRSVIFHETEDQRTVMLHSKKDQQAIMIGLLGAVYGFDEPQIDYIISHDVGLWNFPIAKDRPDIWRQFVQALCCHALDRLPELKARTSWVTVS